MIKAYVKIQNCLFRKYKTYVEINMSEYAKIPTMTDLIIEELMAVPTNLRINLKFEPIHTSLMLC